MEERRPNPRRRRRTKAQIIKETYMPVVITGISLVLIIVFIIGSIVRGSQRKKIYLDESIAASASEQVIKDQLDKEVSLLMEQAHLLAAGYDYDAAIKVLDNYTGDRTDYPEIDNARADFDKARSELVAWDDPSHIVNLSFQMLIADPQRAFADEDYGEAFETRFITVSEFTSMLQQLYDRGYVLVGLKDFLAEGVAEEGNAIPVTTPIMLPAGKKPLMLTQVHVNYNRYMIDGNEDGIADKDGSGFASKLMLDKNGNYTCEYVDANGDTKYGAYDMVPILESFIKEHPDFSYKGSRAILALTAYDGLFGYRTYPGAEEFYGTARYEKDIRDAKALVESLRKTGYQIGCYTYENLPYASTSVSGIKEDLQRWTEETSDILGPVDIFVYAKDSDIATSREVYSGSRYEALKEAGFTVYLGFSLDGKPWISLENEYFRQGRIMVTGDSLTNHANWFTGMFNTANVIDPARS